MAELNLFGRFITELTEYGFLLPVVGEMFFILEAEIGLDFT